MAELVDAGAGLVSIRYLEEVVAAREGQRLLSHALPVRSAIYPAAENRTAAFVQGLLPEGRVREAIARQLRVDPGDTWALLAEIGAECAGAVSILPQGEEPGDDAGVEWLNDAALAARIDDLYRFPLGREPGAKLRASLAGVQGKLVVVRDGRRFGIPLGSAPSTHILKPEWRPGPDDLLLTDLVANEAFCMRLAANAGLPVAAVEVFVIEGRRALGVERFDRRSVGGIVKRIHQEDLTQASGRLPSAKYEPDGGISLAEAYELVVDAGVPRPDAARTLLGATTMAAATGNADQHAKNLALLYDVTPELAPMYDLTSTFVYEELSREGAFRIGRRLHLDEVDDIAVIEEGTSWGVPSGLVERTVRDTANRLVSAVEPTLAESDANGWRVPVVDRIAELVRAWPRRASGRASE